MGIGTRLFGWTPDGAAAPAGSSVAAPVRQGPQAYTSFDLANDRGMLDYLRGGFGATGVLVSAKTALRNPAVYRCVTIISNVIGGLPLQLFRRVGDSTPERVRNHDLAMLLAVKPNHWQTALEFRRLMQHRVLVHGNAYALPIISRGKVSELIPIHPDRVKVVQDDATLTVTYKVRANNGGAETVYPAGRLFHVLGPSEDGLSGIPLVNVAADVIGLALAAQKAASNAFNGGVTAGGALQAKGQLTPEAFARLRDSLDGDYSGADNDGKWMVLEEGLEAKPFGTSGRDNQNVEQRKHQVEDVARIFGVPRPFLMLDDTSWGSGIEQLGMFFVQYGLTPHFVAWEQAIARTLIGPADAGLYFKFNEGALLRGLIKDQGEYFAKALGTGGGRPWMTQDEVREVGERPPMGGHAAELGDAAGMGATK